MVAFLVLLNQLICKFNTALHDILEELYPKIASRIFNIIPRNGFPSGPGSNTEVCELLNDSKATVHTGVLILNFYALGKMYTVHVFGLNPSLCDVCM